MNTVIIHSYHFLSLVHPLIPCKCAPTKQDRGHWKEKNDRSAGRKARAIFGSAFSRSVADVRCGRACISRANGLIYIYSRYASLSFHNSLHAVSSGMASSFYRAAARGSWPACACLCAQGKERRGHLLAADRREHIARASARLSSPRPPRARPLRRLLFFC